jgi:hypothetical protein
MGEPSVALDPEHQVSTRGGAPLSFCPPEKPYLGVSPALGFWSMRHSAIFEEEVDFQEHCVGNLWVV